MDNDSAVAEGAARLDEPGPPATTSGIAPMIVAAAVIRIGRSRTAEASAMACNTSGSAPSP